MEQSQEQIKTPEEVFEIEVLEPTKKAMEEVLSKAISEEDVKKRIIDILPKGYSRMGPMILYNEYRNNKNEITRAISVMVGICNKKGELKNIEAKIEPRFKV